MGFDGEAVVGENGRVTLEGLPYEPGHRIRFHTESDDEANVQTAQETVAGLRHLARYLKNKYPNAPVLGDEAISRASNGEDDGL